MCLCLVEASTQQTDPEELGDTVSAFQRATKCTSFLSQWQPKNPLIHVVEHTTMNMGIFFFSFLEHEGSEIHDSRCLSLPWHNLFS